MDATRYTIGKLAQEAGINVETVRYYQRVGLLREPAKPASGYRCYPRGLVARLGFIKRAQRLGFTLREIAELLTLGDGHCENVLELANHKRARILLARLPAGSAWGAPLTGSFATARAAYPLLFVLSVGAAVASLHRR